MKTLNCHYTLTLFLALLTPHAMNSMEAILEKEQDLLSAASAAKFHTLESCAKAAVCDLEKVALLKAAAKRYKEFMIHYGQQDSQQVGGDLISEMESLFAPECRKIVNGDTVSETLLGLYNQIGRAKAGIGGDPKTGTGPWTVRERKPPLVSAELGMVAVYYEITTERQGTIIVIKYLTCDTKGLITEIDEVFNKKKSSVQ